MTSATTPLLSPTKTWATKPPSTFLGDKLWAPKATYALSNMASSAFSNFLPILYESTAHFSKFQIGVLQALPCICTIVGAPFWCAVADKFENHRLVHYLSIVTGAILVYAVSLSRSYPVTLALIVAANFLNAPGAPLLEHSVLGMITKYGGEYGKQRLFASIGYGLGAYVAGLAVAAAGIAWAFNVSMGFSLGSMIVLSRIPVPSHHHQHDEPDIENSAVHTPHIRSVSFSSAMRQLAQKTDVLALLAFIFLVGLMYGVLLSFLALDMYDMSGQNAQIIGLCVMSATLSEAVVFFYAQKMIDKLGIVNSLLLSVATYAVRISYYAVMTNPWSALVVELLNGISFALLWAAATEYIYEAAPRGTEGTAMGLMNAMLDGAGRGGGTLIGGYLYEHYGARTMWLVADLGVPLALVGLAVFAYLKAKRETDAGWEDEQETVEVGKGE